MSMTVSASITAMAPGLSTSFNAHGGTEPYVYTIVSGGGTIDADTGVYTAPASMNTNPKLRFAVIRATDADDVTADSSPLFVADPLFLLMEILWRELGISQDRVYLWDQKLFEPSDSDLYIAVSVLNAKPFGNTNKPVAGSGVDSVQSLNMMATITLNVMSRSTQALFRKEEVLLALGSTYAQSQQELNSFFIGKLPPGGQFVNLSQVDGAAIPYRFNIALNMQYFVKKTKAVAFFDEFAAVEVTTDP